MTGEGAIPDEAAQPIGRLLAGGRKIAIQLLACLGQRHPVALPFGRRALRQQGDPGGTDPRFGRKVATDRRLGEHRGHGPMIAGEEAMSGRVHPRGLVDRGDPDGMAGIAGELRGMMTHRPPVSLAERVDGIDLVDVVAEPVEKLVPGEALQGVPRARVGKPLVELMRDVGHVRETRAALGDVDRAVLTRPVVKVLEEVPMQGAIAIRRRWKGEARGFRAARQGQPSLGLREGLVVRDPKPVPERIRPRIGVGIVCQGQAAIWWVPGL